MINLNAITGNKMKRILVCLMAVILPLFGMIAQEKKTLTLEDLIPGGETFYKYYPENIYGLGWCGDVCIKPDIDTLFAINPVNGKENAILLREDLNSALEKIGLEKVASLYGVEFVYGNIDEVRLLRKGNVCKYNLKTKEAVVLSKYEETAQNIDFAPNSNNLAYTKGSSLYIVSVDESGNIKNGEVVSDKDGIVYGQVVHRNEFGISKGTFWSPDASKLAFYKMDESMVTEYPLVDIDARIAKEAPIRYPMAGMTSHKVYVGVYDVNTGNVVYLKTADPTDRYFTNISWSPDSKKIYVIELNRDQNHSQLIRYDALTGEQEAIVIEERHEKYVEPQNPITFVPGNDNKFIYQSQRDGYNHLYLYDIDGSFKQLTSGKWLVNEILGFDAKGSTLFYMSTENSPLDACLYKVNIKNGKREMVTKESGWHKVSLSGTGKYIVDSYSSKDVPRVIDIERTDGKGKVINLLTSKNPYEGIDMPTVEHGTIKAADDTTDLYYLLVKPFDFDPSKKYPVVIYVYGGPHAQLVTNTWRGGASGWDSYMAQNGYIVFTLDNRGSANRGLEFENCTFRNLGIEECKDQMKGVEFLKSLPYVDQNRIGVHGWSFGGHMTTALMLRHNDVFKVGVAGGPVIDWALYEVMYGERYMDTPQDNPEGYEATNLNNLAENLKGKLMIIHDYNDKTCVPQHTLQFMKTCIEKRVYPDLFIYPGHDHNVLGRDRVHLHHKISTYFFENL